MELLLCAILGIVLATLMAQNALTFSLRYQKSPVYYGRLSDIFPSEGENVSLKLLTNLPHKPDVYTRDYHILKIHFLSNADTLEIQLTRTDDVNKLDSSKSNPALKHGLYTGTVSRYSGRVSNVNGLVALSITLSKSGHEGGKLSSSKETIEFNGQMILGGEHFVIEPTTQGRKIWDIDTNGSSPIPNHKIYKLQHILNTNSVDMHSDGIQLPKDHLEKGFKELEKSRSPSHPNSGPPSISLNSNSKFPQTRSFPGKSTINGPVSTVKITKYKYKYPPENQKNYESLDPKDNSNSTTTTSTQSPETPSHQNVVELAIFSDVKLYKVWKQKFPNDTKGQLTNFILTMVNNVNLLYQHESLGIPISLRLVHLDIMTSEPPTLPANGSVDNYLSTSCEYSIKQNRGGNDWDHSVLFTALGDHTTLGMAYIGSMCTNNSCSIADATHYLSTFVLTHELGHSLGMQHDGYGDNSACPENQYLMSSSVGKDKNTWSNCSSQNAKDFLNKFPKIYNCLMRESTLKSKV